MKKIIFFLIDGIADPISSKNFDTPLKKARKKNINKLLNSSFLCQLLPLTKQEWPQQGNKSVTGLANLSILGYSKKIHLIKRGPLEAIGSNLNYRNGYLAVRFDFATVNKNLKVIDRRAGRNTFGLQTLINALNKMTFDVPFALYKTYGHRGVLMFLEKNLSNKISDSDPYRNGAKVKKIKNINNDQASKKTAILLQKFLDKSHRLLNNHPINRQRLDKKIPPANYLLTREAGNKIIKVNNFFKKNNFKNGLVIAENGVVKGGCVLAGFQSQTLPEIHNLQQRYNFIYKKIKQNISKYQLIYIHLKEADEASHDKKPIRKQKFFEFFDQWFGSLYFSLLKNIIFIISGDHITNSRSGMHQWGAVPLLIINSPIKNNPLAFDEINAKKTNITLAPKELWRLVQKIIKSPFSSEAERLVHIEKDGGSNPPTGTLKNVDIKIK